MSGQLVTTSSRALANGIVMPDNAYEKFLSYVDASPKTIETYTRNLRQFWKYIQDNNISQPTREDILAYRDEIKTRLKPSTVQNYITVVRVFFEWLEQERIYPNVAKKIKGAKIGRDHKKDYFTKSQVKTIINGIDKDSEVGLRNYAIFMLMVSCGLRTIEVSRANIEDLRARGGKEVLYIQGKGHEEKEAFVNIPAPVEKAIRTYLKARGKVKDSEPLFCSTSNNSAGGRLTTRSISGIVKESMKNAGFDNERFTAHSLRHSAVTCAIEEGQPVQVVQAFARHNNIQTTMIYYHAQEATNNPCSDIVCKAIFDE